jgi:hypothetical protein
LKKKKKFFDVDRQTEENRDCSRALPDGAANQDLVPEPPDEVEEGEQVKAGRGRRRHRRLTAGFKLKEQKYIFK